ncbi:hypothetical protein MBLNU457_6259t1 [Dothideomycetes sp. NU457]
MYSLTIYLSLLITAVVTVQAVPIPSFRDVERAWKEGRSEAEIHAATADYHPTPSWRSIRHINDPSEPPLEIPRTTFEITTRSQTNDNSAEDRSTNKLSSLLDDWALHYLLPTSASATSKASVAGHLNEHKKGVHHRHHHRHRHTHRHHGVDTTAANEEEFEHALDERTIAARSPGFSVEVRAEKRTDEADSAPVLRPVKGLAWNMA